MRILYRFLPYWSLFLLFLVFSLTAPNFLSPQNLAAILRQSSVITIMAIGMTFVIVAGAIDLSVGSLMALSAIFGTMVLASLSAGHSPVWLSIVTALLVATAAGVAGGWLNGYTTSVLHLPSFIVTLGTLGIYRGIALYITNGIPVVDLPRDFGWLAEGELFGLVPIPVIILTLIALVFGVILRKTRLGRYAFAIGSNPDAALYSGIRVARYRTYCFLLLGGLAGLAGMIEAARLITGQPTAGEGYELRVIAAVVIGGGSLSGGEGSIAGTIVGSFIMGILSNGSNLLGISPFVQQIVIGIVIILAVAVDNYQRLRKVG
ncbi:MAG: ABC transporter permease [Acidobacteria bacterium]|nr:MAG: ABC transporter permease [Acidobacteriota bacterium]